MVQISRRRVEKIEEAIAGEREKRRKQLANQFANAKASALHHATAVAAIVLGGQAKIDQPLGQAWARALQHCNIDNNNNIHDNNGIQLLNQIAAARELRPKIMGHEKDSARFTDIFRTAPVWLLQFTGMAWDAGLRQFQLPDLSQTLNWGTDGFEAVRRWPLLPSGILEAGDPIPVNDSRRLWITAFCQIPVPIPDEHTLFQAVHENRSHRDNPIPGRPILTPGLGE